MMIITPEQRLALAQAGDGGLVEIADPQTGDAYIVVRAEVYRKMSGLLEEKDSRHELEAWSRLGRKARDVWAAENAY